MTKLLCQLSSNWQLELDDFLDWIDIDLDEESNYERLKLKFEPNEIFVPFKADLFVLIEGGDCTLDILKLTDSDNKEFKKIASIPTIERGLHTPCMLYKCKNKLLAILNTNSYCSAEVTELLWPYTELAKDVVVVQFKQMLDFRGILPKLAKGYDSGFIRGINSKLDYVEELLPPNIISGASAGLASKRSFKDQSVASYVIFTHKFSALEMLYFLHDIGMDWLKRPTQLLGISPYVDRRPYI